MSRIIQKLLDKYQQRLQCLTTISYTHRDDESLDTNQNYTFQIFVGSPKRTRQRNASSKSIDEYFQTGSSLNKKLLFNHIDELELMNIDLRFDELGVVLEQFENLKLLNISRNQNLLGDCTSFEMNNTFPAVRTLIANETNLNFYQISKFIHHFPNLETLHLSNNNLIDKDCNIESNPVNSIKTFHLSKNLFTSLVDICKISKSFPNLQNLYLGWSSNLTDFDTKIPRISILKCLQSNFQNLKFISLNDCPIKKWYTIELIGEMPFLHEISISNLSVLPTSLFDDKLNDVEVNKRKRYLLIAHLPNVKIVNRTPVYEDERTDSERFCIRYFNEIHENDQFLCPHLYRMLVDKHGQVQKLAEIDMNPERYILINLELFIDGKLKSSNAHNLDTNICLKESMTQISNILNFKNLSFAKVFIFNSSNDTSHCLDEIKFNKVNLKKKMYQIHLWENNDCIRFYC